MIKNYLFVLSSLLLSANCLAEQLSDPTMPATYRTNSSVSSVSATIEQPQQIQNTATTFILNSTIVAPNHKVAIINGVQLKLGDEINGAKIRHITHQQVKLQQQDGTIITLSLQKSFISDMKSITSP